MKIRVFGTVPPCTKCKVAEKTVREVVKELGYTDVEVTKEDALSDEAGKLGIMMTPTIMVDDKVVKVGGLPSKEEIKRAIERAKKGS